MPAPNPANTYKVEDRELLMGFYRKLFWDALVKRIPEKITPNSITILGQVLALSGVLFTFGAQYYAMPILYAVSAFCWLGYLTADNVDGPHARATGQTSVLGEFLDHGLDGLANGWLLITAALVLQIEGVWMVLFLGLGAMGFMVTFWEQYRTGRLVIPELSSAEGVTVVMVISVLAAVFNEPAWLHLDVSSMNFSMGLMIFVLVCYAVAIGQPVWRATRAGARSLELIPVLLVIGGLVLLVPLGASGLVTSVVIGVFGADVVCRIIRLRHEGDTSAVLAPYQWLLIVPAGLGFSAPESCSPDTWAYLALGITSCAYLRTMYISASRLIAYERELDRG